MPSSRPLREEFPFQALSTKSTAEEHRDSWSNLEQSGLVPGRTITQSNYSPSLNNLTSRSSIRQPGCIKRCGGSLAHLSQDANSTGRISWAFISHSASAQSDAASLSNEIEGRDHPFSDSHI